MPINGLCTTLSTDKIFFKIGLHCLPIGFFPSFDNRHSTGFSPVVEVEKPQLRALSKNQEIRLDNEW